MRFSNNHKWNTISQMSGADEDALHNGRLALIIGPFLQTGRLGITESFEQMDRWLAEGTPPQPGVSSPLTSNRHAIPAQIPI